MSASGALILKGGDDMNRLLHSRAARSMIRSAAVLAAIVPTCAQPCSAALTHRYSFNDGTADDSVGTANGELVNGAPVIAGQLVFNPNTNNGISTNIATGQYVNL